MTRGYDSAAQAPDTEYGDYQLIVIGGGPAGLAAAISAKENGLQSVLILERGTSLGGILPQCIHTGFGLAYFQEELTGPEYARRFIDRIGELGVAYKTSTTVLSINADKTVMAANNRDGFMRLKAGAVILATGCREKPRGALPITGTRPAGILPAGAAQKMINIAGYYPGERIVILGSGDVGMILARRLKLEGKQVLAVVERLPYIGGLLRNKVQCLDDFGIPVKLSHTVTEVIGRYRVEGVAICPVDGSFNPIEEEKEILPCDTLITSVGLIPEAELARDMGLGIDTNNGAPSVNERLQTSMPWVFACGNVLFTHDLVDDVTTEAISAGVEVARYVLRGEAAQTATREEAARYVLRGEVAQNTLREEAAQNALRDKAAQSAPREEAVSRISSKVERTRLSSTSSGTPQTAASNRRLKPDELVCTLCPTGCVLKVSGTSGNYQIENYNCDKGREYALQELESPARHVTSTIAIDKNPFKRLPVRTSQPVPKEKISLVMKEIRKLDVSTPVAFHQTLIRRVAGSGADIIASADMPG